MNEATEDKRKTPQHGAAYAAQMVREALMMLVEHDGLSPDDAIAGAHAEIVATMVQNYGGLVAAERCTNAARRIAHLPSEDEACGFNAPTAGRC